MVSILIRPPHPSRAFAAAAAAAVAVALSQFARADEIRWSDGRAEEGDIAFGANSMLRLHDGARVLEWEKRQVAAVAFEPTEPTKETMERAWRFIEAGKTAKEFSGGEYPVIELSAHVALRDGTSAHGHLMTSAVYLEQGAKSSRVVLRRRLKGREGETYSDLVYPASLAFDAPADPGPAQGRAAEVAFAGAADADPADVACVWLKPFPASARVWRGEGGALLAERLGEEPVVAHRAGGAIGVAWPWTCPGETRARIEQGVADIRDFFDDRKALAFAAFADDPETAFSLVLASRAGATTLDGGATQPWRLEVWRWRLGEGSDILLSTRAVLFRGLRAASDDLPTITVTTTDTGE